MADCVAIRPSRKDLLDTYIGWSDKKTLHYLKGNSDTTVILNMGELYEGRQDLKMEEALLAAVKYSDATSNKPKIVLENLPYNADSNPLLVLLKKTFC